MSGAGEKNRPGPSPPLSIHFDHLISKRLLRMDHIPGTVVPGIEQGVESGAEEGNGHSQAPSGQKGNSTVVCGVTGGPLEEMRSWLAGRGKGEPLRQAQPVGKLRGARGHGRRRRS